MTYKQLTKEQILDIQRRYSEGETQISLMKEYSIPYRVLMRALATNLRVVKRA